jgi:hypothetical protein
MRSQDAFVKIFLKSRQKLPMTHTAVSVRPKKMKRPVNLGNAWLKMLVAVVALGAAAHASMPYLPLLGPPPLRIQVVQTPATAAVVEFQATPSVTATNRDVAVAGTLSPGTTNTNRASVSVTPALIGPGTGADLPVGDPANTSIFGLPTPDMLGITPQALAAYFRPIRFGTNAPAPLGSLPLVFVPPLPPDNAHDKSSHAEYIVK